MLTDFSFTNRQIHPTFSRHLFTNDSHFDFRVVERLQHDQANAVCHFAKKTHAKGCQVSLASYPWISLSSSRNPNASVPQPVSRSSAILKAVPQAEPLEFADGPHPFSVGPTRPLRHRRS